MKNTNLQNRQGTKFFCKTLATTLLCLASAAPAFAANMPDKNQVSGKVAMTQVAGTLDKVRDSGKLNLGYRADTKPFSYNDEAGKATGYSVALCQKVADAVKAELKLRTLTVVLVPVTSATRFEALQQGQIDLECGTSTPTLGRRAIVDFSIPIFSAGIGALVRSDVDLRVRDALSGRADPSQPIWRGAPGQFTEKVTFAVVGGTTIERTLIDRLKARRIEVTVTPVPDYATGAQMVADRRATVLFGDKPVLHDTAKRGPAGELAVIDKSFTREPVALALRRGDDQFRLLVDRVLSQLFRSKEMGALYSTYFGTQDMSTMEFFQSVALPD